MSLTRMCALMKLLVVNFQGSAAIMIRTLFGQIFCVHCTLIVIIITRVKKMNLDYIRN